MINYDDRTVGFDFQILRVFLLSVKSAILAYFLNKHITLIASKVSAISIDMNIKKWVLYIRVKEKYLARGKRILCE